MSSLDERGVGCHGDARAEAAAWASSGAMALTGWPDAPPLGPPRGLVSKLSAIADVLDSHLSAVRSAPPIDPLALLGERAALGGLTRQGTTSCGGATRLLRTRSGWLAVSLARPEDVEVVPAWLELDATPTDVWATVEAAVAARATDDLVARARLVGLPIGQLPASAPTAPPTLLPVRRHAVPGSALPPRAIRDLLVVDLGTLWAGPLCGSLLAAAGATVVKVESVGRPDGARLGPGAFFDLLNAGKRGVAVDLGRSDGIAALQRLLRAADVVIETSRPRALEQFGIDAITHLATGTTRVWATITGHGRTGEGRDRPGFGDDAAVAGGLVCWDRDRPVFCADAIADPTSGLVAAAGILDALASGGRWLLDVSMASVAAHLAGPTLPVPAYVGEPAAPHARTALGRGPRLGEHTAEVFATLSGAAR
ncbi:MAG: CoA transferase [Microthrixaceae bacterium]